MSKKSRTKKTSRSEESEPIYYLDVNASQADALYRAVRRQKRVIAKALAEMTKDDDHCADDLAGYLHQLHVYNELDEEVGGVVGYFENGYFDAPDLRQKLPITEARRS